MAHDDSRLSSIPRVLHSDWSKNPTGRWACWAERSASGWRVFGPTRYADCAERLFADRSAGALLAGFDFPIGVPLFWARMAGIESFPALLAALDDERWQHFFEVATAPDEIALERPFYPARGRPGIRRAALFTALGAPDMASLLRRCDRSTPQRRAACCLFWTLGGQQVGKAALSGWREVVLPERQAGARLWPFDGSLAELGAGEAPIIAETYPAEAYGHVGIRFGAGRSKRRQADRQANADAILSWAERAGVVLESALERAIADGFGAAANGEDQFDAMAGLAGMIEVVDGRRAEAPVDTDRCVVEGWILGQLD